MSSDNRTEEKPVPYHGAAPVLRSVRKIIAETATGERRLMSAGIMVELLRTQEGLSEPLANRLFSQIRKGAPLYQDWKDAFACQKFIQRVGRASAPPNPASLGKAVAILAPREKVGLEPGAVAASSPEHRQPRLSPPQAPPGYLHRQNYHRYSLIAPHRGSPPSERDVPSHHPVGWHGFGPDHGGGDGGGGDHRHHHHHHNGGAAANYYHNTFNSFGPPGFRGEEHGPHSRGSPHFNQPLPRWPPPPTHAPAAAHWQAAHSHQYSHPRPGHDSWPRDAVGHNDHCDAPGSAANETEQPSFFKSEEEVGAVLLSLGQSGRSVSDDEGRAASPTTTVASATTISSSLQGEGSDGSGDATSFGTSFAGTWRRDNSSSVSSLSTNSSNAGGFSSSDDDATTTIAPTHKTRTVPEASDSDLVGLDRARKVAKLADDDEAQSHDAENRPVVAMATSSSRGEIYL